MLFRSEATPFSYWSIKPWFLTEGKLAAVLIIPFSWGSQRIAITRASSLFSGAISGEKKHVCKGSLSLPIFLLCYCFAYFIFVCFLISKILERILLIYFPFSYWSIKPWFLTEGKLADVLIIPSSWGSQRIAITRASSNFSGAVAGEKKHFCKGSLSLSIFLLCYCFAYLFIFCFIISKIQKK